MPEVEYPLSLSQAVIFVLWKTGWSFSYCLIEFCQQSEHFKSYLKIYLHHSCNVVTARKCLLFLFKVLYLVVELWIPRFHYDNSDNHVKAFNSVCKIQGCIFQNTLRHLCNYITIADDTCSVHQDLLHLFDLLLRWCHMVQSLLKIPVSMLTHWPCL